jgi:hypothetical protein
MKHPIYKRSSVCVLTPVLNGHGFDSVASNITSKNGLNLSVQWLEYSQLPNVDGCFNDAVSSPYIPPLMVTFIRESEVSSWWHQQGNQGKQSEQQCDQRSLSKLCKPEVFSQQCTSRSLLQQCYERCNRLTDMDGPTRCSSLIQKRKEHLKTGPVNLSSNQSSLQSTNSVHKRTYSITMRDVISSDGKQPHPDLEQYIFHAEQLEILFIQSLH